jgi:hypothetical protein
MFDTPYPQARHHILELHQRLQVLLHSARLLKDLDLPLPRRSSSAVTT